MPKKSFGRLFSRFHFGTVNALAYKRSLYETYPENSRVPDSLDFTLIYLIAFALLDLAVVWTLGEGLQQGPGQWI